jgi:hypothetical protein
MSPTQIDQILQSAREGRDRFDETGYEMTCRLVATRQREKLDLILGNGYRGKSFAQLRNLCRRKLKVGASHKEFIPECFRPIIRRAPNSGDSVRYFEAVIRRWFQMNRNKVKKLRAKRFAKQLAESAWGRNYSGNDANRFWGFVSFLGYCNGPLTLFDFELSILKSWPIRCSIAQQIQIPSKYVPQQLIDAKKSVVLVKTLIKKGYLP